ncbi:hypothetical protein FALBO_13651 [Fusarium albosuccineum]|uniref:V-SNARE coiled-coil homology domain-containing protein n=1 Tax=Fusarium albosuccineum TaxID=1237068 RepID=A0A8H4L089_9HYPO|nr:hypothetical protein FALBO_13651 [Fusarium albosuccineum]
MVEGDFEGEFEEQGGGEEHQGRRRRRRRGRRGGQGRRGQGNRGQGNRGGNAGQAAARPNPQTPAQQGDPSAKREPEERAAEAEPAATAIESLRAQLQAVLEGPQEAEEGSRAAEESRQAAEEEVRRLQSQCEGHEKDAARIKDLEEASEELGRSLRTKDEDLAKAQTELVQVKRTLAENESAMVEKDRRLEALSDELEDLQVVATGDSMVLCRVFDDIARKAREFPVFRDEHLDLETVATMGFTIGDDDCRRNIRRLLDDAPIGAWFCFSWVSKYGQVAPQVEHLCGTCRLHRDLCRLVTVASGVNGERQLRFFNPKD